MGYTVQGKLFDTLADAGAEAQRVADALADERVARGDLRGNILGSCKVLREDGTVAEVRNSNGSDPTRPSP